MAEETRELVVPELGESITEAVIGVWLVAVGEYAAEDEPVVELETDKITVQLPAPAAGVLVEQLAAVGDTVHVGAAVGRIDTRVGAPATPEPGQPAGAAKPGAAKPGAAKPGAARHVAPGRPGAEGAIDQALLHKATPAQRRALRMGRDVPGLTGPAVVGRPAVAKTPVAKTPASGARERVVEMSPLRKRIAERLVKAQAESASLTTFNEIDMSAVMALRARYKQSFVDAHGVKLGFLSFFIKACVAACKQFPGVNAEIRGDAIAYKEDYHFGVAVSTDRGLVVPVVRNVDALGFAEVERAIVELATRARTGKLTLHELTGGTFTITNGGVFGSMLSTPLLNHPQTGILGMHNIVRRPVAVGQGARDIELRPIMYVALTYDHRVVDGREAVQFLVAVKQRVEHPEQLMFDL